MKTNIITVLNQTFTLHDWEGTYLDFLKIIDLKEVINLPGNLTLDKTHIVSINEVVEGKSKIVDISAVKESEEEATEGYRGARVTESQILWKALKEQFYALEGEGPLSKKEIDDRWLMKKIEIELQISSFKLLDDSAVKIRCEDLVHPLNFK